MKWIVGLLGFVVATVGLGCLHDAGDRPGKYDAAAPPRLSTFAPAEDLVYELYFLVDDLEKAVADKDEFDSQIENRFVRDGDAITLLATAWRCTIKTTRSSRMPRRLWRPPRS